jgi:hypothetical protein
MSPLCQLQMTLPGGFPGVLGVTVRLMSDGELSRLEVRRDLDGKRLTTAAAAQWGSSGVRCSGYWWPDDLGESVERPPPSSAHCCRAIASRPAWKAKMQRKTSSNRLKVVLLGAGIPI